MKGYKVSQVGSNVPFANKTVPVLSGNITDYLASTGTNYEIPTVPSLGYPFSSLAIYVDNTANLDGGSIGFQPMSYLSSIAAFGENQGNPQFSFIDQSGTQIPEIGVSASQGYTFGPLPPVANLGATINWKTAPTNISNVTGTFSIVAYLD